MYVSFKKCLGVALATMVALIPTVSLACTSFVLRQNDGNYVYARTMEFGMSLQEKMVLFPRNYAFKGVGPDGAAGSGLQWTGKNAIVGINAFGLELVVDGMNEKGMSGGMLNLPNEAEYQNPTGADAKNSIASWQILLWALSNFDNTDQVKENLPKIFVNSSTLGVWKGVVKIHVTLHDPSGKSIVIEYVKGKLNIHDNPIGVMANDPPFDWHIRNLGNYINASPIEREPVTVAGVKIVPPSSGSGLHGLPGDFLSPSRFLRAFFFSQGAQKYASDQPQVELAWHLINMFDIPPGSVMIPAGSSYAGGVSGWEYTQVSIVTNSKELTYHARPFGSRDVMKFEMKNHDLNGKAMKSWDMIKTSSYKLVQ